MCNDLSKQARRFLVAQQAALAADEAMLVERQKLERLVFEMHGKTAPRGTHNLVDVGCGALYVVFTANGCMIQDWEVWDGVPNPC